MHIPCTVPDCDHTGAKCEARLSGYPLVVLVDAVYTLELDDSRELFTGLFPVPMEIGITP